MDRWFRYLVLAEERRVSADPQSLFILRLCLPVLGVAPGLDDAGKYFSVWIFSSRG
jgi:hypothetical protein